MSALFGVLFFHTPILAQSIRPSAHRSSPPCLIRLDLTVLLVSPCLFDLTAYNHLKLQCMCDGPSSCMNDVRQLCPQPPGVALDAELRSISADHRNMHYSRSVLCDSTSATTQFLHPMTPLPLCVVDGYRVWLDRRVRRIRPI
ncbi:hypothetical protein B0H13DRAFT_2100018 [Mycena leptocephala]|nr:hypothetical protein B0H13DRAFT_2100018 [Mycena leptocephala]